MLTLDPNAPTEMQYISIYMAIGQVDKEIATHGSTPARQARRTLYVKRMEAGYKFVVDPAGAEPEEATILRAKLIRLRNEQNDLMLDAGFTDIDAQIEANEEAICDLSERITTLQGATS